MLALKTTVGAQGGAGREAEIELDFMSKAWTIRNGRGSWPGVVYHDSGHFERKLWGDIWLLDGPGSAVTRTPVILRDAPRGEDDAIHMAGGGQLRDPANNTLKNSPVSWQVMRRAAPVPPTHGPNTPIRKRVLEECAKVFPQKTNGLIYFTSQRRDPDTDVTNCGAFPGLVFSNLPVIPPNKRGAFKVPTKGGDLYLTSPMTNWHIFAQAIDAQRKPANRTWVPFKGNRPLPGDIYILWNATEDKFQHVGIIVSAQGGDWVTADGGQGAHDGFKGGWINRKFHESGEMTGEFDKKARLYGWVDLDYLYAVAQPAFPRL